MEFFQLNATSLKTFLNQLNFYQEENNIIVLQATNIKHKLEIFRNWKRKFHSTFNVKNLGFDVATLIKNDIRSVFVNKDQSNLEDVWNLVETNGKQI